MEMWTLTSCTVQSWLPGADPGGGGGGGIS